LANKILWLADHRFSQTQSVWQLVYHVLLEVAAIIPYQSLEYKVKIVHLQYI